MHIGQFRLLLITCGVPDYIRSYNGGEFTATAVHDRLNRVGVKTLFIEPASSWKNGYNGYNGYNELFNGKSLDELLNVEIFDTLLEAKVLIERWRHHYNATRSHSAPGYRLPAPEAMSEQKQTLT